MRSSLFAVGGLFLLMAQASSADYPIAGIEPSKRPEGAPTIDWVSHDRAWYEAALTGVQQPYPQSLFFLDNQGDWYTPFSRPGMTGRYDLRGWHQ